MAAKVTIAVATVIMFCSWNKVAGSQSLFYPGVSDFSKVVKAKAFVDKSFLIFDVFSYKFVHITAPRLFGKSTNLDMFRRFVELDVDEDGQPKPANQSANYKLFQQNNLTIFQHKDFVAKHFGKYPVLYIDFIGFKRLGTFKTVVMKFESMVKELFLKHKYILNNDSLFVNKTKRRDMFEKYCNGSLEMLRPNKMESSKPIYQALMFLTKMMTKHFNRQVFILIDNYDSHLQSLLFKRNTNLEKNVVFIHTVFEQLVFENDDYVFGALLTGELRSSVLGTTSDYQNFRFLHDMDFCHHYGITESELDALLIKTVADKEREQVKSKIVDLYKGYTMIRHNEKQVYSTWSVLNYLGRTKNETEFWCKAECFDLLRNIFRLRGMTRIVEKLLSGKNLWINIKKPIYKENVSKYNAVLRQVQYKSDTRLLQFSVNLLYHFGFLTVLPNSKKLFNEYRVQVPNKEIELALRKALAKKKESEEEEEI